MPVQAAKRSGKNRKYGRNKKSASAIRYKAENRASRNKTKRAIRHAKLLAKHASKYVKVPRGTARGITRLTLREEYDQK